MSGTYSNVPCTEEGYNTLAILSEFIFSLDKIPMIDMKVLVYFNFGKKYFWKKMKSPSSMKNGRFHPSKYRGKVQNIGEETFKGLFPKFLVPAAYLFGLM